MKKDRRRQSTILVIEDNQTLAKSLGEILESEGFHPVIRHTGTAGLDACRRHDAGVAVLDLRLPDMDGLEVLTRLKDQKPDIKVIINTAHADLESALGAINREAFAYTKKGETLEDLLHHVHRAFHAYYAGYSARLEAEINRRAAELRASEELHRITIENISDPVFITDDAGGFTFICANVWHILGFTADDIRAMGNIAKLTGEGLFRHEDLIREGEIRNIEAVMTDKSGQQRDFLISVKRVAIQGGTILYVCRDITEHKKALLALKIKEQQLHRAEKMEAVGNLAAGIAQDFNDMLGAIILNTELVMPAVAGAAHQKALEDVLTTSNRAAGLVKQFLIFSRRTAPVREPVRASALLKEALTLLRPTVPETVAFRYEERCDTDRILINPAEFHQIVINLFNNAVHAMGNEKGEIAVALTNETLAENAAEIHPETAPGTYVKLLVRDTGPGVPPEHIPRIFDPLFTTKRPGEGAGMGLAVIRGIVEDCGGAVAVSSAPGKGSAFAAYLPAHEPEATETEDRRWPAS